MIKLLRVVVMRLDHAVYICNTIEEAQFFINTQKDAVELSTDYSLTSRYRVFSLEMLHA